VKRGHHDAPIVAALLEWKCSFTKYFGRGGFSHSANWISGQQKPPRLESSNL